MFYVVYFQLVFDMLVLQKHNTEMTTAAGEAFYTLVCLHQVLDISVFMGLFSKEIIHTDSGPLILVVLRESVTHCFRSISVRLYLFPCYF